MRSVQRDRARRHLLRLAAACLTSRTASPTGEPRRVLLLRPDHIGDVLLTSPAVAMLRDSLPGAHLTYLVGPWSLAAARRGPPVGSLRTIAFPGFTRRRNANLAAPYGLLLREALRLRRERYDLAIVLRPDHWWGALLALAAGIPVRVGGRTPETSPLLTHTRLAPPGQHAAEQALDLARLALRTCGLPVAEADTPSAVRVGGPVRGEVAERLWFGVSEAARAAAERLWRRDGLDAYEVIGLHPNAGAALKSWPVDSWARLADRLTSSTARVETHQSNRRIVLVGAPDDGPLLAAIQRRMRMAAASVAFGQDLDVSAALYERCAVVVSVDSGAAHLAAAVGTPTVRLYGPAPSAVFGPWPAGLDQRVLATERLACVPCGHLEAPPCGANTLPACLLALGVEDVQKAVELQLARD